MREVTDSAIHNYIPEFKEPMFELTDNGIQKNYMIKAYVQGSYLDDNVTTERDGFIFGKEEDIYSDLSEKQIMKAVATIVKKHFQEDIQKRYNDKKKRLNIMFTRLPLGIKLC